MLRFEDESKARKENVNIFKLIPYCRGIIQYYGMKKL